MIRIVERLGRAVVGRIVEIPLGRRETPDQLVEVVAVRLITLVATLRCEIELIPPLQFSLRRQRCLAGCLTSDQIAAHRHNRLDPLRPQRRNDIDRARAPIEAAKDRLVDLQCIHQCNDVDCDNRLLPVARRICGQKTRRPIAAQIRDDDPVAGGCQDRRHFSKAIDIVWPAVQQDDHGSVLRARFRVTDIERPGIDLANVVERSNARCTLRAARRVIRLRVGESA